MWFHIDPSGGMPIYLQIINQIKKAAAGGLLSPGEQLPSVRELAVQLAVNPNTVAKAYQELERENVIETIRGRGTFLAAKESVILEEERIRMLRETINDLLVEAHHLRISSELLTKLFLEQLGKSPLDSSKGGNEHE